MATARTHGFGFDPAVSQHHFAAFIPGGEGRPVTIEERQTWAADAEPGDPVLKVTLDRYRWERIAEAVRGHFNQRLRAAGKRSASWKTGENLLPGYYGRELTLLAWAVEDAEATLLPNILANWLGLAPEERWWLYTTVNATSGHPEHGRDRGWRKAIRIAFAENPAEALPPSLIQERTAAAAALPAEPDPALLFAPAKRPRAPRKRAAAVSTAQMSLPVEEA